MNFLDQLNKAAEIAANLSTQYAPIVWQKILFITQIDAASVVFPSLTVLILSIIYLYKLIFVHYPAAVLWAEESSKYKSAEDAPWFFVRCVLALPIFVGFLVSTILLFNMWLWVKLLNPELFLAYKILNNIL
jgi:hypothetical protein